MRVELDIRPGSQGTPTSVAATAPRLYSRVIRAVLTHPVVMACKLPVRDAIWTLRGGTISNPTLPASVVSMLFVCKGNICRSPFAAALAERRAGSQQIVCRSAGLDVSQAARAPREACDAAARYGIPLGAHRPTPLTAEAIQANDMTIVMEAAQLALLRSLYPSFSSRFFLLPLFDGSRSAGYQRYNIADPFGQPLDSFVSCYQRIDRVLDDLFAATAIRARHAS